MMVGVVVRAPCVAGTWASPNQFWHACFTDLTTSYSDSGLSSGFWAFLLGQAEAPTPVQPPLTGLLLSAVGSLVPDSSLVTEQRWFFALWAVVIAALVAVLVWLTAAAVPRHVMRAAHVALAPVLALSAIISADMLGVVLAAAALLAWARSRPMAAGVLFGLAVSARTYPALIIVAIVLVAVRAGRLAPAARMAGVAVATWLGILVMFLLLHPEAATRAYSAWARGGAGYGSVWVIPQLAGHALAPTAVMWLAITGWAVALVLGAVLALAAPRRPGVAEVSLVMVVVVMVTGASLPVQSSIWLVPLVALVGLSWRDHLAWAGVEAVYFMATWLYIAGTFTPTRGLPVGWYAVFLLLRLFAIAALAYQTWGLAWSRSPAVTLAAEPDRSGPDVMLGDVPSGSPETDELAGILANRPDALVMTFVR